MFKNIDRFKCPVPAQKIIQARSFLAKWLDPGRLAVLWACLLIVCYVLGPAALTGQIAPVILTILACLVARNVKPVLPGFIAGCSGMAIGSLLLSVKSVHVGAAGAILLLVFGGPSAVFVLACLVLIPLQNAGGTKEAGMEAGEEPAPERRETPAVAGANAATPLRRENAEAKQGSTVPFRRPWLALALAVWVCALAAAFFVGYLAVFFQVLMTALTLFCCFLSGNTRPILPGLVAICVSLGLTVALLNTWGESADFTPALTWPLAAFVLAYILTYPLRIRVLPLSARARNIMGGVVGIALLLYLARLFG